MSLTSISMSDGLLFASMSNVTIASISFGGGGDVLDFALCMTWFTEGIAARCGGWQGQRWVLRSDVNKDVIARIAARNSSTVPKSKPESRAAVLIDGQGLFLDLATTKLGELSRSRPLPVDRS